MMKTVTFGPRLGAILLTVTALAYAPATASSLDDTLAGDVKVTVKYTGKGEVDDTHRLWIWLFDSPNIGPGAMPISESSLTKNGDAATFKAVSAEQVWIAVAYDEKGGFAGSAPPPTGAPVMIYGAETGAFTAVAPGDDAAVTVTFNDSMRMQ